MKKTVIYLTFIILVNSSFAWLYSDKDKIERVAKKKLYPQHLLLESTDFENWNKKDSLRNKELWYLEIQYPFKTSFTAYWNSCCKNQYHAKTTDFEKYFKEKDSVLLAIQIGPYLGDLWSYRQLIFHKIEDFIVVSNSYFRHNRFTYKGISILDSVEYSRFYKEIIELRDSTANILGTLNYSSGYFEEKVKFTDTIETYKIYVDCKNDELVSGIIIDNTKSQSTKLYGFSDSYCEKQDSLITAFRNYQANNWLKVMNNFEWKTTYPEIEK